MVVLIMVYHIVFMSWSFRYAGVGGSASWGGWCGGYFRVGSVLRYNFLLLENCWRSPSFQYPYDTRIKDKIEFYFLILFKTPQQPPLDDKNFDPSNVCTKQQCVVHWLCCFDDIFISFKPSPSFPHLLDLESFVKIFKT